MVDVDREPSRFNLLTGLLRDFWSRQSRVDGVMDAQAERRESEVEQIRLVRKPIRRWWQRRR